MLPFHAHTSTSPAYRLSVNDCERGSRSYWTGAERGGCQDGAESGIVLATLALARRRMGV